MLNDKEIEALKSADLYARMGEEGVWVGGRWTEKNAPGIILLLAKGLRDRESLIERMRPVVELASIIPERYDNMAISAMMGREFADELICAVYALSDAYSKEAA